MLAGDTRAVVVGTFTRTGSVRGAAIAAGIAARLSLPEVDVLYSGFANLPFSPWPVLPVLLLPIPAVDPVRRKQGRRLTLIIPPGLSLVRFLVYNLTARL